MFIIKYRKIFLALSVILVLGSAFAMFYFGFNWGIDFKGGSITEVSYPDGRPALEEARAEIKKLSFGDFSIQPAGDANYIVRTKELNQNEKNELENALSIGGENQVKEERFNSIGPVVGAELRNKAFLAVVVVILGIVLFVTFAFRKVSRPVSSWKYGLATVIALAHDVVVSAGIFIVWSKFHGGEIDLLFVTAILAILGYSVHDTIVVFDRVRENLRGSYDHRNKESFEAVVGESINQTFVRSVNTSLTIFIALMALYFLGGETTRNFAFILIVGVVAGTYSSIFLASPLLVLFEKFQHRKS